MTFFYAVAFNLWLTFSGRICIGHDTWQYFSLQYYFLGNAAYFGEIPQWLPHLGLGTEGSMWYATQGGFVTNILLFIAPLLKNIDFRVIFNTGILFQEIILIVGSWLLCRRFLKSPITIFIVTISLLNSSVWATQYWFNFSFLLALPLSLYVGHCFLETAKYRYLFLLFSLIALQTQGNLPYFIVVFTLIITVYFILYAFLYKNEFFCFFSLVKVNWRLFAATVGVVLLLILVYKTSKLGMHWTAVPSRDGSDASVSLHEYLTWGNAFHLSDYLAAFVRTSFSLDWTFYFGYLPIIGFFFAFKSKPSRSALLFSSVTIFIFLTSLGACVSTVLYYLWPFMSMYRHLSLINILNKVFILILAGIGIDGLLFNRLSINKTACRIKLICVGIVSLVINICIIINLTPELLDNWSCQNIFGLAKEFASIWTSEHYICHNLLNVLKVSPLIIEGVVFCMCTLFLVYMVLTSQPKNKQLYILLTLFVFCLDSCGYRVNQYKKFTFIPEKHLNSAFRLESPFFVRQWWMGEGGAPLLPLGDKEKLRKEIFETIPLNSSKKQWISELFLQSELINKDLKIVHYSKSLYDFYKLYFSKKEKDSGKTLYALLAETPPLLRVIGASIVDRIQFYQNPLFLYSLEDVSKKLQEKRFSGEGLFLFSKDKSETLADDHMRRIDIDYEILKFSANNIVIQCSSSVPKNTYLYYADGWHPWWKADVNGHPAKIYQANIAFKAVALDPGVNVVSFNFNAPNMDIIHFIWFAMSFFWVLYLFYLCKDFVRFGVILLVSTKYKFKFILLFIVLLLCVSSFCVYFVDCDVTSVFEELLFIFLLFLILKKSVACNET
ncbi:hypothetical protein [Solidesulfovibrio magneticus]|uniref:hypothetical protein n=1 Tax=Solidesulfovibrio magneticus TaxID=184917 RepID=UPI0011D05D63|nr:hypothetical protein [Solidesulfovibrio magneticus]